MATESVTSDDRLMWERNRTGCSSCRGRRIECDEKRPKCLNCIKAGIPCDGGLAIIPKRQTISKPTERPRRSLIQRQPYLNAQEGRAFHFVAIELAPFLGNMIDDVFWVENVLPVAYSDRRLFYAVLAYSCRYHSDVWQQQPNHKQQMIKWYNKSISHSLNRFRNNADILLNVKLCGLYGMLENAHGDPQTGSKLIHSAFSMIYGMRDTLKYSEDAISTLSWITDTSVTSPSGLTRVGYVHHAGVCELGLKLSKSSRYCARYEIAFDIWRIMYDVDTFLLGQERPPDLKSRLDRCGQRMGEFRVTPSNSMIFLRMRFLYALSRIQYELYMGQADDTIRSFINSMRLVSKIEDCRKLLLDSTIGPGLGFLLWHYKHDWAIRHETIQYEIDEILRPYNHPQFKHSLDYWLMFYHILRVGNRRSIALELWGEFPRILRLHHWLKIIRLRDGIKTLASVASILSPQRELSPAYSDVSEPLSSTATSLTAESIASQPQNTSDKEPR